MPDAAAFLAQPPKGTPKTADAFLGTPYAPAAAVESAVPGARLTSGLRTPQHNAAVGGVRDSLHLSGEAEDFTPPAGMTRTQAEAAIRAKDPHPRELLDEGDHVHYAPGADAFLGQPPPKSAHDFLGTPPVTHPTTRSPNEPQARPSSFLGEVVGETRNAAHQALESARANAGAGGMAEILPALGLATSPIQGLASAAEGRSPANPGGPVGRRRQDLAGDIAASVTPLPGVEEAAAGARVFRRAGEAFRDSRLLEFEGVGGVGAGEKPGTAPTRLTQPPERPYAGAFGPRGRSKPITTQALPPFTPKGVPKPVKADRRTLAAAREKPRPEPTTDIIGDENDPVERVDNALYRAGGHGTAAKVEALQTMKETPKEIRDPKVQEELTHAIEQRMIDPKAEIPEHLQAAEAVRQPWAERQRTAVNNIRERLATKGLTEDETTDYAPYQPDTGYVPRRVEGKSPGLDPADTQRKSPLAWKRGGLGKTTGSLKARDQIVLEDETGKRTFEHRNPSNQEWKPGMQVAHPLTGKPVTVKPATIREIEAAGARDSKGKPLTYGKNALVNTIDEALKAERVERNLDLLDEITDRMKDEGLAHREEWRFKGDDGIMNVVRSNKKTPDGFIDVPQIPQLKGWKFDPKVAEVLKDYFPGPDEPLDNILSTVNRALNASLFITPFPHIKNVGTMGFIGRGWDWLPGGGYGRLMKTGRDAIKEVWTLGPRYRQFLRDGAGMQAADEATRNFYDALLTSATKGIEQEGGPIKAAGLNPVEVVKALYNVSHKILWNVNDMVMLQRYMELQSKGMASRDAIKETERWIANYRIPPQVFKSRAMKQFIADGTWINFGRYTYGKWKAIGEMAKGLASGPDRINALGKVVAAGLMALVIYPLLSKLAQAVTGNKNAKVGMGGELTPVEDLTDKDKGWISKAAAFMTPAPLQDIFAESRTGKTVFGQDLIDPNVSTKGKIVEGAEAVGDQFYPTSLGLEALKPRGAQQAAGRLFGVNLPPKPPGAMKGSTRRSLKRRANKRERSDPLESMIP